MKMHGPKNKNKNYPSLFLLVVRSNPVCMAGNNAFHSRLNKRLVTVWQTINFLSCVTSFMSRKSNVGGDRNDGLKLHVNVAAD